MAGALCDSLAERIFVPAFVYFFQMLYPFGWVNRRDHPLGAGEPGPAIVVQPGEAAAYPAQARNGDSLVPVTTGEQLTERQALQFRLPGQIDSVLAIIDVASKGRLLLRQIVLELFQLGARRIIAVDASEPELEKLALNVVVGRGVGAGKIQMRECLVYLVIER